MAVEIIDPVADYERLMEALFDFDSIRDLFRSGFRMPSSLVDCAMTVS